MSHETLGTQRLVLTNGKLSIQVDHEDDGVAEFTMGHHDVALPEPMLLGTGEIEMLVGFLRGVLKR